MATDSQPTPLQTAFPMPRLPLCWAFENKILHKHYPHLTEKPQALRSALDKVRWHGERRTANRTRMLFASLLIRRLGRVRVSSSRMYHPHYHCRKAKDGTG